MRAHLQAGSNRQQNRSPACDRERYETNQPLRSSGGAGNLVQTRTNRSHAIREAQNRLATAKSNPKCRTTREEIADEAAAWETSRENLPGPV